MTKPDDIDQDTWEKAWSIVSDIQMKDIKNGLPAGWEVFASIDRIARAIMSARAEEREAILALVRPYKHHDTGHEIYEAIRNRP